MSKIRDLIREIHRRSLWQVLGIYAVEEAAAYYTRFVDLWQDADPELQPQVKAARGVLARLTGER